MIIELAWSGKVVEMKPLRLSFYVDDDWEGVRISGTLDPVDSQTRGQRGVQALGSLTSRVPGVVVLDLQAAQSRSCDEILEAVRRDADLSSVPIVVCSADAEFLQTRRPLLQELKCDLLAKPCDLDALLETIDHALRDESEPVPQPGTRPGVDQTAAMSAEPELSLRSFCAQLSD